MIAGYHLAGLLLHDMANAIVELAHLGYGCVAVRPNAGCFHPDLPNFSQQLLRVSDAVARSRIRLVIDLDGLYLHDPFIQRGPSLIAASETECDEARRWVIRWVAIADEIGADLITFSSGPGEESEFVSDEENLERLSEQLQRLLTDTSDRKTKLAIRPHVHDVIGSVAQFERLQHWLGASADQFGLAADIGEMLAAGELPVSDRMIRNLTSLQCVYLSDRRAGMTGDQRFGHGDVAVDRIVQSLGRAGYKGPAIVRIEGHSELGLAPAREAIAAFE